MREGTTRRGVDWASVAGGLTGLREVQRRVLEAGRQVGRLWDAMRYVLIVRLTNRCSEGVTCIYFVCYLRTGEYLKMWERYGICNSYMYSLTKNMGNATRKKLWMQ